VPDIGSIPLWVGQELSTAGPHVRSVAATLTQSLQDLRNQLAPVAETWDSQAHSYYDPLEKMWDQSAQRLFGTSGSATVSPGTTDPAQVLAQEGVLGEIAQALDRAWENYVLTEGANTHIWRTQ
jgi:hypothetical protein